MPRKIRELKSQLSQSGFIYLAKRGKGSHERWRHPLINKILTIVFRKTINKIIGRVR